jgi:hypothetical protein
MAVIAAIIGSIRKGRLSEKVCALQHLKKRDGVDARLLDLRDFPMPSFDQPATAATPGRQPYKNEGTVIWPQLRPRTSGAPPLIARNVVVQKWPFR